MRGGRRRWGGGAEREAGRDEIMCSPASSARSVVPAGISADVGAGAVPRRGTTFPSDPECKQELSLASPPRRLLSCMGSNCA